MSAIPPIHVATSQSATPPPASRGTGAAQPGYPFAEAMRSAVSSAQPAAKASDPAGASGVSRSQFDRSKVAAAANAKRGEEPVSAPSSQTPSGNPASIASSSDGRNANSLEDIASPSVPADGVASSPVDGQAQSSTPILAIEDQSSGIASQRVRTPAEQSGSLPSDTRRKQTLPAKDADASASASGSSPVATATSLMVASVTVVVPQIPMVKVPAAAELTFGTKSSDTHTTTTDSSLSNSGVSPGLADRIPQAGVPAVATAVMPNEAGISTDGNGVFEHSATALRGKTTDDKSAAASSSAAPANTKATSDANQKSGPVQDSSGHPSSSVVDGTSAHAVAQGASSSPDDANNFNPVSGTGGGNSGATGADVSDKDRGSMGAHGGDASKSSSFAASIPPTATAAKDLPAPQSNHPDMGAGLQNSPSIFSSVSHSGPAGSSAPSTASPTTTHAATSDAFTALDSAASGERGVLLHAAPNQVAIGVSDPSLGWVEVRAERVSGQIAAALTTSSAASHAALTSVLPTMSTYLQEHQAGVHQVHVETSLAGGQTGTGSNGQASSQNQARSAPDNLTVANAASNAWNAAPVRSAAVASGQRNNFLHEGSFSIRA